MIALSPTDNDWFNLLRNSNYSGLVNFWTPTDWKIASLTEGDYWYFVLKGSEPRKIGGGGRFVQYKVMKASEAWATYGLGNGSSSYTEMVKRLNGYRQKRALNSNLSQDPVIGCIILDNCIFLPDQQQKGSLAFGLDFPRQIVKYKTFHNPPLLLNRGSAELTPFTQPIKAKEPLVTSPGHKAALKGIKIIEQQLENSGEFDPKNDTDARERVTASIVKRRGQPAFRQALMVAYSGKCAISGCDAREALEAAHIIPYMGEQTNAVQNGLLLRADFHTLFDLGLIAISPIDLRIILHSSLKDGHYSYLSGKMISVPNNKDYWPSTTALKMHIENSKL